MFRFENLDIWNRSIELSNKLFDIAEKSDKKHCYRFSEQLRAAAMSISNNIAEGSASVYNKEFAQFLNIARRSAFECANILIIYEKRNLINNSELKELKEELQSISKMIFAFRKTLK
jgi:four helix bundle protein